MPRKEINDYKFYKIVCLDNSVELCYVGSTANWKARNHQHKNDCNNENSKAYSSKKYQTIRENGGWDNFKMIQIGTREQLTKRQAEQVEEEYRIELKANMNTIRCFLTEEQKQEQKKEQKKKWCEDNINKHRQYQKNYYEGNKEQRQIWLEENKDKLLEYQQNYREENRDKISENRREKCKCVCGCEVNKRNLLRHQKSPKHINLMNLNFEKNNN